MGRPPKQTEGRASARDNRIQQSDGYQSMFHIDPSWLDLENYHYAYVEMLCMNQPTQSANDALRKGYTPVLRSEIPQMQTSTDLLSRMRGRKEDSDDFIREGDQMLMKCPRISYEKREAELRKTNKRVERHIDMHDPNFLGAPTFIQKERTSMSRTTEPVFASDNNS